MSGSISPNSNQSVSSIRETGSGIQGGLWGGRPGARGKEGWAAAKDVGTSQRVGHVRPQPDAVVRDLVQSGGPSRIPMCVSKAIIQFVTPTPGLV